MVEWTLLSLALLDTNTTLLLKWINRSLSETVVVLHLCDEIGNLLSQVDFHFPCVLCPGICFRETSNPSSLELIAIGKDWSSFAGRTVHPARSQACGRTFGSWQLTQLSEAFASPWANLMDRSEEHTSEL